MTDYRIKNIKMILKKKQVVILPEGADIFDIF